MEGLGIVRNKKIEIYKKKKILKKKKDEKENKNIRVFFF